MMTVASIDDKPPGRMMTNIIQRNKVICCSKFIPKYGKAVIIPDGSTLQHIIP